MSAEKIVVQAQKRGALNKGELAKLRSEGAVPAVVYGKKDLVSISVAAKNLPKGHTRSQLLTVDIEGAQRTVLMREVQFDPMSDKPIHIDFQEVAADELVKVKVPLEFTGLTKEQEKEGSFKTLLRSLEVQAKASQLPTLLTVKVGHLKIDETAHISDVELPDGVKLRAKRNLALASLVRA